MVSMAFVLFRLLSDNERGKADARIAARQETARNLFAEDQERAGRLAARFGTDPALARAMRADDPAAAERRTQALVQELGLARSSYSYEPATESEENLELMRLLDEQYTRTPFYGVPRMTVWLHRLGYSVNHKRVARLMRRMGLHAIYPESRSE
jgi:transposase InsO family protein